MLRVPNASPSGLVTNFETKCSEYFHPRVLVYILRNKAAYLARNSPLLNQSSRASRLRFPVGITPAGTDLHIPLNAESQTHSGSHGSFPLSGSLQDELDRISCSLISCISCVTPQSAATVLLSLIKLNYYNRELFSTLVDSFMFDRARPKAVALTLYALTKCPRSLEFTTPDFFCKIKDFLSRTVSQGSCQDITVYLVSIAKLRESSLRLSRDNEILDILTHCYRFVLNYAISVVDRDGADQEPSSVDTMASLKGFSVFELSNILESLYIMRHYDSRDHAHFLRELQVKLPLSINYIDHALYVMNLFKIGPKSKLNKNDRVAMIRLNKKFCEECLAGLTGHLKLLKIDELSKVAQIINNLRLWTDDAFFEAYTDSFLSIFNKYKNVLEMDSLVPILVYYSKRYEAAINREYYFSNRKTRDSREWKTDLNEVSNRCGYVCELLQDHFARNHPKASVEELLNFTSKLRTRRSMETLKHKYKSK